MPLYKADSNDSTKQVPVANNRVLVKEARVPAPLVIQSRPNHVIINNSGSYAFLYTSTGSSGGTSHYNADDSTAGNEIWVTGSMILHGTAKEVSYLPVKLDINPVAWRQTDGTITGNAGDITFVFNGKYMQNGGPK